MKALVAKTTVNGYISCEAFQRGLLEWRNTPKAHRKSPAELVYGCQMRSVVPRLERNLSPPWKANIEKRVADLQEKSKRYYNIGAKDLKEIGAGDKVCIQDRASKRCDRSKEQSCYYFVELTNSRLRWRNRKFLCLMSDYIRGGENGDVSERDQDFTL